MIPNIKTILYATDLGENMRPVFRLAISLARQYEAQVLMLHALEPLSDTGMALVDAYLPKKASDELHKDALKKVLKKMRKRLERSCIEELGETAEESKLVSEIEVIKGIPWEVIQREAEKRNVDIIVIGTHTSDSRGGGLLGSTARKLTHVAAKPVLVVPVKRP